jgi:ribosomal protein S18 acetylase RimI-like enzyme
MEQANLDDADGIHNFKEKFNSFTYLKAVIDSMVVDDTCHVGRLIVHPNYQKMGIGTELMDELENLFQYCNRFEIFTGDKCISTIQMYEKRGYSVFKTVEESPDSTVLYMEKDL